MCQSVSPCVASNQDVRQEEYKATEEMNRATGDLVAGVDEDVAAGEDGVRLVENDVPPPSAKATSWASTFAPPKLAELREKLAGVNTSGAVVTGLGLIGGAVGAYFLWPTAVGATAAAATMKAPGAAGLLISRAAFLANPQLYFQILRTAGAAAAAAAFAV